MRPKNYSLRNTIFEQGTTHRDVAAKAGISEATLSMIIRGKYIPDNQQKTRIASVLGKRKNELFPRTN